MVQGGAVDDGSKKSPQEGRWVKRRGGRGGDFLDYFVEAVYLLSMLCRERHTANIKLIRSLPGMSFKEMVEVVEAEAVPLAVRAAFAELLEDLYLDVTPLYPRPGVSYTRIREGASADRYGEKELEEKQRGDPWGLDSVEAEIQLQRLKSSLEFSLKFLDRHTAEGGMLHEDGGFVRDAAGEDVPWTRCVPFTPGEDGEDMVTKPVTQADALKLLSSVVSLLRTSVDIDPAGTRGDSVVNLVDYLFDLLDFLEKVSNNQDMAEHA
ncbi:unnamed protein product, partial [Discosporangium mesarthrocarpum]